MKYVKIDWSWPKWSFQPPRKELEEEFGLWSEDKYAIPPKTEDDDDKASPPDRCLHVSGTILLLAAFSIAAIVLCREYLGGFMGWVAGLHGWHGPVFFGILFIFVSFPMMWGYIILNMGAGYLFGLVNGVIITSLGAGIGAWISFTICRLIFKDYVLRTLSGYDNFKQIVRVIEGRQGWRIIMMTRLTPVPFGLQNALFSAAKISNRRYVTATFMGLLPTQILNTYMGTTLRSMEDVLAGKSNNTFVLVSQVFVAVGVTWFVNQRMKSEVNRACEHEQELTRQDALKRIGAQHVVPLPLRSSMSVVNLQQLEKAHTAINIPDMPIKEEPEEIPEEPVTPIQDVPMNLTPAPSPHHLSSAAGSPRRPPVAGSPRRGGHRRSQSAGPILTADLLKDLAKNANRATRSSLRHKSNDASM